MLGRLDIDGGDDDMKSESDTIKEKLENENYDSLDDLTAAAVADRISPEVLVSF